MRGRGLLAGIEFVRDKKSRDPFPREARFAEGFTETARQVGLIVWPNIGHADGTRGDMVCIAPPFVITESEMDELVTLFASALQATTRRTMDNG